MKIAGRTVLVCDCGRSMPLDGKELATACGADGAATVHSQLCRGELDRFERHAAAGGAPLLVACTQEAPLFTEIAGQANPDAALSFVNIRETAGWSQDAGAALPKMAALIAEAAPEVPPTGTVTLKSEGVCLVYGTDERAIEAARRLAGRLDVTVLLSRPRDVPPPRVMDVPVFKGTVRAARGRLGQFEIVVDDYAPAVPSSRDALRFEAARQGAASRCDVILDLTGGPPLFPAHGRRDGYLRPDPDDPAAVARALFDAADLVGEFEKPRYVAFKADLCAHSRSRQTGCTRCLDVCPTGAIAPAGDHVAIDPYVCAGCGSCAAVCPTGAATYALPPLQSLFDRLRTLLGTYHRAGGRDAVLLVHDPRHGADVISLMARHGRGLPAAVLPFAVHEVTQLGLDFFAVAHAYGAAQIRVLTGPANTGETAGLASQIGLIETAMSGLGYGSGRVGVIDDADPDAVEAALWSLPAIAAPAPGSFLPMGGKRTLVMLALRHLHAAAPQPVEVLPLPAGAPFGGVAVNTDGCTLCLSCVGACPTGALLDNPDKPMLSFTRDACVQCGLCRSTCPEKVVSLVPEIDFRDSARRPVVIKEEEPFCCVRCGKPFATKSAIDKIVTALAGRHWMFATPEAANRIRMCEDCRVVDQFERDDPFKLGGPRVPRTTEDYLRERDERKVTAAGAQNEGTDDGA
ncbi:4Fe-4S binding protein [Azospirillum halopraeferens]|uniref:4Fe-4S binding protein n=1 Tax=Azospirillum halopraeferens TaxID=34010 RepID=UPI00041BBB1E|nr:4Fe-4S binding protein [Azospirillum halopraeferens]